MKKILLACLLLLISQNTLSKDLYIDKDSVGGTCADTYTYAENDLTHPWCTFDEAFWDGRNDHTFSAGDVIYIRAGTYTAWLRMRTDDITYSGTSENPVIIRPYAGEAVTISSGGEHCIHMYDGIDYLTIDAEYSSGQITCWETRRGFKTENDATTRTGLVIDGLIHDANYARGKIGIELNDCISPQVLNSTVKNLFQDGEAVGFGVRDGTTNPYFYNSHAENINDRRGKSGDGDGFWGESTDGGDNWLTTTVTLEDCTVKNVSEDGVDFKATGIILKNVTVENALTVGVKFWRATDGYGIYEGGTVTGSGEDGIKVSDAVVDIVGVTLTGNNESGIQLRDNESTVRLKNSIIYDNGESAIDVTAPGAGNTSYLYIDHSNIFQTSGDVVTNTACSGYTYDSTDVTDGTLNSSLVTGWSCSGGGTVSGTTSDMQSENPDLTTVVTVPDVYTLLDTGSTTTVLVLEDNVDYPWSAEHGVGDEVEVDSDGILREVTAVSNPNITIANDALSVAGRDGIIFKNWGPSPPGNLTNNLNPLDSNSPGIDAGEYDSDFYCPTAGATGDCLTWYGSAPDIGYYEISESTSVSIGAGTPVIIGTGTAWSVGD